MKPIEPEPSAEDVTRLLSNLRAVSPLNPQTVAEERAKFLSQAEGFRSPVSREPDHRHNGWMSIMALVFQRKERIPMFSTFVAVVVALAVAFGGAGATVYAAQGSMPDEALYPVKTWSEDLRLSMADSAQEKLSLTLEFTDRRVVEITNLQARPKPVKPVANEVALRLQAELESALQIAAGMEEAELAPALAQIRLQAEAQVQTMAVLQTGAAGQADPALTQLQERLQEQVQMAADGQADPHGFRLLVRDRDRVNRPDPTLEPTPAVLNPESPNPTPVPTGNRFGPGEPQASEEPGQFGPGGPNPEKTPAPTGESYGPGPGAGQQPTTTPGGYGPGPQNGTPSCTPVQNNSGAGAGTAPSQTPQAGEPGSGQSTATQQPGGPGSGSGPATQTTTPQAGEPGSGAGQTTITPQAGGGNPTAAPGGGGR